MLRIYQQTFVLALKRAVAAWRLVLFLLLYAFLMERAIMLGSGLGMVGGFLLGLVAAACVSGYLSMLAQAIRGTPLRLADLKDSFGALFWDVISVMFAVWIIDLLVAVVSNGAGPNAEAIVAMAGLAMAFFLNPVPEMIYLRKGRSFDLLLQSSRFVLANPVAWFLPNVIFLLVMLAPTGQLNVVSPGHLLLTFSRIFSLRGLPTIFLGAPPWTLPLLLLFFHFAMVFRGLLFEALSSGNNNPRRAAWVSQLRP